MTGKAGECQVWCSFERPDEHGSELEERGGVEVLMRSRSRDVPLFNSANNCRSAPLPAYVTAWVRDLLTVHSVQSSTVRQLAQLIDSPVGCEYGQMFPVHINLCSATATAPRRLITEHTTPLEQTWSGGTHPAEPPRRHEGTCQDGRKPIPTNIYLVRLRVAQPRVLPIGSGVAVRSLPGNPLWDVMGSGAV